MESFTKGLRRGVEITVITGTAKSTDRQADSGNLREHQRAQTDKLTVVTCENKTLLLSNF